MAWRSRTGDGTLLDLKVGELSADFQLG
eukprot:COSAG05_NODE_18709_length_304_cov_0.760976_1_plen_27_part_01